MEILVDDGTALIKTVLWGEDAQVSVVLGDLVLVEGKLNVDKNWDAVELLSVARWTWAELGFVSSSSFNTMFLFVKGLVNFEFFELLK